MAVELDIERGRDAVLSAIAGADPSIEERKTLWRRFWDISEPPGEPLTHASAGDAPPCEQYIFERRLEPFLRDVPKLLRDVPHYIPVFPTLIGAHQQASAFGCETFIHPDEPSIWSRPLLQEYDPDAAMALEPPDPASGLQGVSIELARRAEELFEGQVAVRIPDMQGPLDVAGQVCGPANLLRMLVEHPHAAHHAVNVATQALIDFYRAIKSEVTELAGPHCPGGIWCPPELGNAVSEDYAPLVSREMYEEFSVPYIQRIADETGGLFIHCCGTFEHTYESMAGIAGLTGVNPAIPVVEYPPFARTFADVCVLVPTKSAPDGPRRWPTEESWREYITANTPAGAHLVV